MQVNTQIVDTLINQFSIEELEAMLLRKRELQQVALPKEITPEEAAKNRFRAFLEKKLHPPIRR